MGANGKGNEDDAGGHVEESARATGETPEPAEAEAPTGVPGLAVQVVPPPARGAAWAQPVARFEARWTWLESRLLTFVLVWQILALVAWVFLNGLSESVTSSAGAVFRAVVLAASLGLGTFVGLRKKGEETQRNFTLVAMAVGVGVVMIWRRAAMAAADHQDATNAALTLDRTLAGYFDNIKGWLQEGSTLTLLGGLRGLGTRLTLWLALLGGSLATATGKHIHVDVIFRFVPRRARVPVSILNQVAAAAVCLAAVWGFFDHIAIESYGSRADDPPGVKIHRALHHIGDQAFLTRKQLGLDGRSLPHVLAGERYDQWMTGERWNAWVDGAGFESRYEAAKIAGIKVPEGVGTHPPFVVSPDGENPRGALAHTLGLVFPFGLLAIGLRFLIRALLMLSGHDSPDPDAVHKPSLDPAEGGA